MMPPASGTKTAIHATAICYGRAGLLISGAPGSGKSSLARALLHHAELTGGWAALVADDRVELRFAHGRLIARPFAANRNLLEVRGLGLVPVTGVDAAVMTHAVLLDPAPPRMPAEADRTVNHLGVALSAVHVRAHDPDAVSLILAGLDT